MLLPITRILWPTDFSEASYEALARALELCAHFPAELFAVHVVTKIPRIMPADESGTQKTAYVAELKGYEQELHKAARQRLHEVIQQRVPKDLKSAVIVTRGDPCESWRNIGCVETEKRSQRELRGRDGDPRDDA